MTNKRVSSTWIHIFQSDSKMISFLDDCPEKAALLHPDLNGNIKASDIIFGASRDANNYNKIYWWKCELTAHHVYQMRAKDVKRGRGCSVCNGKQICAVDQCNSLAVARSQDMFPRWHPDNGLNQFQVLAKSSTTIALWQCANTCPDGSRHEWRAAVYDITRTDGKATGCPICSKYTDYLCQHDGCNSLLRTHPQFAQPDVYDYNANPHNLWPEYITAQNQKDKLWWICSNPDRKCVNGSPHRWQATVSARVRGQGCHVCANNDFICQIDQCNSIAVTDPELAAKIHPDVLLSNGLTARHVTRGSLKTMCWICDKPCPSGAFHYWFAPPNRLTKEHQQRSASNPYGCSVCGNTRVCPVDACNSLFALGSELLQSEWHVDNPKTTREVLATTHEKFKWKCSKPSCGHEWVCAVEKRTLKSKPTGCPKCQRSHGENAVHAALSAQLAANQFKWHHKIRIQGKKMPLEFDFIILDVCKVIEFDGHYHFEAQKRVPEHKFLEMQQNDRLKNAWCKENKVTLLRIHYKDLTTIADLVRVFINIQIDAHTPTTLPHGMRFVRFGENHGIVLSKSYPDIALL